MSKSYHDEDWLREQHIERGKKMTQIADECGCSVATISRWIAKHDIETNTNSGSLSDPRLKDKDWLWEQYVERGRTLDNIGEELGCTGSTVGGWLKKHGIETYSSRIPAPDPDATTDD